MKHTNNTASLRGTESLQCVIEQPRASVAERSEAGRPSSNSFQKPTRLHARAARTSHPPARDGQSISRSRRTSTDEPEPDGLGLLRRIEGQCLLTRTHLQPHWGLPYGEHLLPQRQDFRERAKRPWDACLAAGLDVNEPEAYEKADPPLFHYLAHHV
jgi:hypothetical protein